MKTLRPLLVLAFGLALGAAAGAQPMSDWSQVSSGARGELMARDGDAMFLADYFSNSSLRGEPAATRLETSVGSAAPPAGVAGHGFSARWTTTLTPAATGLYPLALRASGAGVLKLDGKVVLSHSGIAQVELERGKPYEIVVELRAPSGQGHALLEWGRPDLTALPAARSRSSADDAQAGPSPGAMVGPAARFENAAFILESRPDGTLQLTEKSSGASAAFQPEVAVVDQPPGHQSRMDPKGAQYQDDGPVGDAHYLVPSWDKETDYLAAAHPRTRLRASAVAADAGSIRWSFPDEPGYSLTADLTLPAGEAEPCLTLHLVPRQAGQFSIGYVGAPAVPFPSSDWIWQPLVWQDRRFPNRSYLTKEFECPLPLTMVGAHGEAIGVGADPKEMPFRMPTSENSRFGVVLRNADGEAQPAVYAPVLGGPESKRAAGQAYDFSLRFFVRRGAWYENYRRLALGLYQFGDSRENGLCSLNTTIDHFIAFILTDRFSYWFPRFKTWGYQNDGGPGAGRQQSAADAISLALVCDNADFLRRRSLPTLEYMLSRRSVSIRMDRTDFMGGSTDSPSDLTAAYRLTGERSTAIRELLERGGPEAFRARVSGHGPIAEAKAALLTNLTRYRLTGDARLLHRAEDAADRYIGARIDRPAANFSDSGSFWPDMAPAYDMLYELYSDTGDRKYLAASAAAMREFCAFPYLVPVIPPGDFVANPGGRYNGQPVPQEILPAWRVAANGLAAECSATAHSHRGVFMASYAAYMARLAFDTGDPLLQDIARSAIVGRYANYPSYAYRNGYSSIYEKPDYPLRPFEEIKKFTSAHYNHPVPMAAFLVDYLVSDVYARSEGRISFPSDFTDTGAYFRNRIYGARPGRFYDDTGVFLWLPKALVHADSIQLNYLAGYGNGNLYLAFSNQSPRPVTARISLDPVRAPLTGPHSARVWRDNAPAHGLVLADGSARITVAAKGLTCLAIAGFTPRTEILSAALDSASPALPEKSTQTIDSAFGPLTATALRFGKGLTTVHVWLTGAPPTVKRAVFHAVIDGASAADAVCDSYPFEHTFAVPDGAAEFRCLVAVESKAGPASAELRVALR